MRRPIAIQMGSRLREGLMIISLAFSLFLFVTFTTYHNIDPDCSSTGVGNTELNRGGKAGAFIADFFLSIFGCVAYLFPLMIVFAAWVGMSESKTELKFKWGECS